MGSTLKLRCVRCVACVIIFTQGLALRCVRYVRCVHCVKFYTRPLRCVRCVVKETAPNGETLMRHTVDDKYWQWFTSQRITTFFQYWQ